MAPLTGRPPPSDDVPPPPLGTGGRYFILDSNRRPSRVGMTRWKAQQATRAVILADDMVGPFRIVTRFPGRKLGTVDGESLWFVTMCGNVPLSRAATAGEALRMHRFIVAWLRRTPG